MKMIDIYKINKIKYKDYVVIIRVGNFYEIYGEQALILHNLLNYKIKYLKDNIRVGFPLVAYNKVTELLNQHKINYVIIDNEIYRKYFKNNAYNNYISFNFTVDERIEKINQRLNILKKLFKYN